MDIILTWLHHHFTIGNFDPLFIITTLNKVDMNTKQHGGETLQRIINFNDWLRVLSTSGF